MKKKSLGLGGMKLLYKNLKGLLELYQSMVCLSL